MIDDLIIFVRDLYETEDFIPLHAPGFSGNEKKYLLETIDSTFVSSVGAFVDRFEADIQTYTQTSKAVATVNGTAALHTALFMSGVGHGDVVITQALTFVATCNAISQLGAEPAFVDVSRQSMGMSPQSLTSFLTTFSEIDASGLCRIKQTGQRVKAVVPMHTFGHPVELDELACICEQWNLTLIEDAAESLGSFYKGHHTGTIGKFGALSFNGNKIITTGGGGMLMCRNKEDGDRAKHITTTAKVPHPYEFVHDELGFNYRLPNLNAALGVAQFEHLSRYLEEKRFIASEYERFFQGTSFLFVKEPSYASSNYWLNALVCENFEAREALLRSTNEAGVMTRPIWRLMHRLPMFKACLRVDLEYSEMIENTVVNLPSMPRSNI